MQRPLLGRRSPALRPISTSQHSRQITICRATGSEPETDWKPVLGTSSRIFSCFLAASVAFGSPEFLLDGDPALALDFPSSTEQRQALNQRRREVLREAKERALQQVSGDSDPGKSEDSAQEKVQQTQKSTLDLLTESVQEQQKRYEEQISKSKILVPKSSPTKSFTSPELPKFSFPSFGGSSKKTEEPSKKTETSKVKKSPETKSEVKEKQESVKSTKTESSDAGSAFSDLIKKYGGSSEEAPKTVVPKTPPPVVSRPKVESTKPKDEDNSLFHDLMKKFGTPSEEKPKPMVPTAPPVVSKPKKEPAKSQGESSPSLPDFMKRFSAPEEKPKPAVPKPLFPKFKQEPAKPETNAPSPFSDFMKKYAAPEEKPKPVTPKMVPPVVSKPKEEPSKPQDESTPALPDFMKKYAAPEETTKPVLPPVVIPKPKQESVAPQKTAPSRFSDLMKKYSAPEEEPKPIVPPPPPVVSRPKEEPAKPKGEEGLSFSDFMKKYGAPEEAPKPVIPPPIISVPRDEPKDSESIKDVLKKKYESMETTKPSTPTRKQISRKAEQKKIQKAKRRGILPLWATQFLMLGLFGGFIYCFTVLYDTTSKITKSTFATIDQFLEDLKFSYDANQSSENNKS